MIWRKNVHFFLNPKVTHFSIKHKNKKNIQNQSDLKHKHLESGLTEERPLNKDMRSLKFHTNRRHIYWTTWPWLTFNTNWLWLENEIFKSLKSINFWAIKMETFRRAAQKKLVWQEERKGWILKNVQRLYFVANKQVQSQSNRFCFNGIAKRRNGAADCSKAITTQKLF